MSAKTWKTKWVLGDGDVLLVDLRVLLVGREGCDIRESQRQISEEKSNYYSCWLMLRLKRCTGEMICLHACLWSYNIFVFVNLFVFTDHWLYIYIYALKKYTYIYIYGHPPPPMIHLQAFYMGITSVLCTFFFTRKMTFSCFYFFYLLRKLPTQTHTHTCNFVFVYFFVISWGFGQKPKNIEKTKKNKKTKIARPM